MTPVRLDRPAPEGFGKADLGFQRPAIGADVYELVAVVLAERRGDTQARAEDEILPVVLELRGRQRRRADEVHREAERWIGETRYITLARHAEGDPFRRERRVWHDHVELRRFAEHVERRGVSEDADVRSLLTLSSGSDGSVSTLPSA